MPETDSHPAVVEHVRSHFATELSRATLHLSPFPYLVLPAALPDDVYERVLRDNPFNEQPGRSFGDTPRMRRLRYRHTFDKRFDIPLTGGAPGTRPVFAAIGDAFADGPWLHEQMVRRFPEYYSLRFGDAVGANGFWDRFERQVFVQRHEPGFRIGAHTDIPTRVVSMIFSFADREGLDECGTLLLAPKDPLVRCWGNNHHPIEGFDIVDVAPYRPNHCLVFFKTRHSFHAVSPVAATAPNGRYGMQVQVFERGRGALVDLSEPELLANRQARRRPLHRVTRRIGRVVRAVRPDPAGRRTRSGEPAP